LVQVMVNDNNVGTSHDKW